MNFELSASQSEWQASARQLAEDQLRGRATAVDLSGEYPWDNLRAMAERGFCGLTIPSEYGGAQTDLLTLALVTEELARGCASTATILMAFVVASQPIVELGTHEQKLRFLPAVASGDQGLCFCVTERHAGSDVTAMQTTAVRTPKGWVLNGRKDLIGNVGPAGVAVVVAKTDPAAGARGISMLVVDKATPGVRVGEIHEKMGLRGTVTGELIFEDVLVSEENLLGQEGRGFRYAMQALDVSRTTAAAQFVGLAQAAFEESVAYSKSRIAFDQPIGKQQAIRFMLADMATDIAAARALLYSTCGLKDSGKPFSQESSMVKLFASQMVNRVVYQAMQIHGGWGYLKGCPVERFYRDARIAEIFEGTSEIQRLIVGRHILGD